MAASPESTNLDALRLLEDEPVPGHWVDELKLEPFARIVAGAAVGTRGPFTIGVFADWGLGKTSVLRQAKSLIENDPKNANVVTVWFNAWQYEKEEHPIVPLVASVVRDIEKKLADAEGVSDTLRETLAGISRSLRAIAYGLSAKVKLTVPLVGEVEVGIDPKEMIDRQEKLEAHEDPLLERTLYYNAFETLEKVAGSPDPKTPDPEHKIVVFVDDLDRCLPPQGLKLLESIKLVLAQRGFIFVLAVDRRVLEAYLDKLYSEEFGMKDYKDRGTSYLDKIVQLPLPLPSHRGRFEEYIKKLLARPELESDTGLVETLTALAPVLSLGAGHNPRNLVRFINNLIVDRRLFRQLAEAAPVSDEDFYAICTVSRILQQVLEVHRYRMLAGDDEICAAILEGPKGTTITNRLKTPDEQKGLREERRTELLSRLDRPEVIELLDHEGARPWFDHPKTRLLIDEFLVATRTATREPDADSAAIIEKAIRNRLNKPTGEITADERRSVTKLSFAGSALTDVSPLSGLTGLQRLNLDGTQVSDVSPLSRLTGLQTLYLRETQVSDVSPLSGLTGLLGLVLLGTQVSDVSPLSGLTGLQGLHLDGTQVSDVSPLSGLIGLQTLVLTDTQVSDVSPLSGLSGLQTLWLGRTQVSNVSPLSGLSGLQSLSLTGTQVTDAGLTHLKGLTGLQKLWLDGTQVTDEGLTHLKGLTGLQRLWLDGTQVTDAGRAALEEDLPGCFMHSR